MKEVKQKPKMKGAKVLDTASRAPRDMCSFSRSVLLCKRRKSFSKTFGRNVMERKHLIYIDSKS